MVAEFVGEQVQAFIESLVVFVDWTRIEYECGLYPDGCVPTAFEQSLRAAVILGQASSPPWCSIPDHIRAVFSVEDEKIELVAQGPQQVADDLVPVAIASEVEHLVVDIGTPAFGSGQIGPGERALFRKQPGDAVLERDVDIVEPDAPVRAQYRLEAGPLLGFYSVRPGGAILSDPGHDNPVGPMRDMLRSESQRPVQGADGRAGNKSVGDILHGDKKARRISKRCAEGHDPRRSQVKRVPALAGEGKIEALQPDHSLQEHTTGISPVANFLADLLLPFQGPDPARIPSRAVRREDQGAPVQIEKIGAGVFVVFEFHQDLIVGGHPDLFDGIGMREIEGAGFAPAGGLERFPHDVVGQVPPETPPPPTVLPQPPQ